jgi:hypothetical protein
MLTILRRSKYPKEKDDLDFMEVEEEEEYLD